MGNEPRTATDSALRLKHERLVSILRECGSVAVDFSGSPASVLLARAALDVLGPAAVLAVTHRGSAAGERDFAVAAEAARRFGIPHAEAVGDDFRTQLVALAAVRGYEVVLDGATAGDDGPSESTFAAVPADGLGIRSPLREAGINVAEAVELARRAGLGEFGGPESRSAP